MSYIIKLVEVFKDYGGFILANWYIFAIWTILCIAITSLVFKALDKKQKDQITGLKNEVATLQAQLEEQKENYEKMGNAWLAASRVTSESPSAKAVSDAMKNKYNRRT